MLRVLLYQCSCRCRCRCNAREMEMEILILQVQRTFKIRYYFHPIKWFFYPLYKLSFQVRMQTLHTHAPHSTLHVHPITTLNLIEMNARENTRMQTVTSKNQQISVTETVESSFQLLFKYNFTSISSPHFQIQ